MTLCFRSISHLLGALEHYKSRVQTLKNKFASPTPMGYSDINMCISVPVGGGHEFVAEVQLNLDIMVEAKAVAHEQYEIVRTKLPRCAKAVVQIPAGLRRSREAAQRLLAGLRGRA